MQPTANVVELDLQELEAKLCDVEQVMGEGTARPFRLLLGVYLKILYLIEAKNASIGRLRRLLFGARTEKTRDVTRSEEKCDESAEQADRNSPEQAPGGAPAAGNGDSGSRSTKPGTGAAGSRTNHGRTPAREYTGCERVLVTHADLRAGCNCPHCQEGILYRLRDWGQAIRLKGQPPVGGTRYELERLRCGLCGKVESADLPEDAGSGKFDPSVASIIGVLRYGQGLPWNRIEKLQKSAGIPLPASIQWEQVRDAVERGLGQVYRQLLWEAAQGDLMHTDDTHMRVLELAARIEHNEPVHDRDPQRRGVFTSGILSVADDRPTIAMFFTGVRHSGENLRDVLAARLQELPTPLQMCDALSRNMPSDLQTIVANCLCHGRRNFVDLAEIFPAEVRHVLECLKEVYRVDGEAKRDGLAADERLRLHQKQSGPVMDQLHAWLTMQLEERRVEPNSTLGQAIRYMLRHWLKLTLFLRVAGAPLDNNLCERALKMSIRHRKNSLFYKTQRGAEIGDLYMSLIHTCYQAGVDAFDYLTELQRNHERVAQSPADWLPWNYRQQLDAKPCPAGQA